MRGRWVSDRRRTVRLHGCRGAFGICIDFRYKLRSVITDSFNLENACYQYRFAHLDLRASLNTANGNTSAMVVRRFEMTTRRRRTSAAGGMVAPGPRVGGVPPPPHLARPIRHAVSAGCADLPNPIRPRGAADFTSHPDMSIATRAGRNDSRDMAPFIFTSRASTHAHVARLVLLNTHPTAIGGNHISRQPKYRVTAIAA